MKRVATLFLLAMLVLGTGQLLAAGHIDPPLLQIQSVEKSITIDGKLDETDWQRRFDHLVFRPGFVPGDVEYGVTGEVEVQGPYADTTTTIVKVLHDGFDLYISLQSNDKSVCKFDGSWEGDGLFMKIADAAGQQVEYKMFFNQSGADPDINVELPGMYPNSGEGAAYKMPGTVVNDTTAADSGYTAELVIHLDQLGYTNPYADVPVLFVIMDCDGYTGEEGWEGGTFMKQWWGSEWGPDTRTLRLADPVSAMAVKTESDIVLDGQLNEAFWSGADEINIGRNQSLSTAGYYMQWGDSLNEYTDQSEAMVKFVHKGTDLYIGIESNDSSVCKWSPGWEADGLFLWMTYKGIIPGPAERLEIKNMYFSDTEGASAVFEMNGNVPTGAAEGASFEPEGTVTHTASNGADAGYSMEVVVHTDMFGYSDGDTVKLGAVIWDLDYSSADIFDEHTADYAPNWWGSQWADPNFEKYFMYRSVILSDQGGLGTPELSVAPTALEFGEVTVNTFVRETFDISNTGTADLLVNSIVSDDPAFTADMNSFVVEPGEAQTVTVTFLPTEVKEYAATMTISSDAGDAVVTATGTGLEAPVVEVPGHTDPTLLQIQSLEKSIVIDGKLDEQDWQRRFDHLIFRENFIPGDVEYGVTGSAVIAANYQDTTTTILKVLHDGLDLYISLQSNDESVCKFANSWEGDGLFMKIADAEGQQVEYKLFFNHDGEDPDIHFEQPWQYPGSGEGAAVKGNGTIVNDNTAPDSGYTAEMLIHLEDLGYTDEFADVPVLFNIFDCDGYEGGEGPDVGSFIKAWWGSEWGPDTRILRLSDPTLKNAIRVDSDLVLDGQLSEAFWQDAESVVVKAGSNSSTAGYYMQWGDLSNDYTDSSAATIKFAHKGTDLYIGVESDDKSVCKWSPGWEADGLFLWMTYNGIIPTPGERLEIKTMYFNDTEGASAVFETNGNVPTGAAEGASFEPEGTVTHTASNGADAGYSLEVIVHTDFFGYADGDTVKLSTVIWDLDYSSADIYDPLVADYHPLWWGAQWADPNFEKYFMYRNVVLSDMTVDVADSPEDIISKNYVLSQNYPNPFNPATMIEYALPVAGAVRVEIYNMLGGHVKTLVDTKQSAGVHTVKWDATDENGLTVSNGVYFYKISAGEFTKTRKMLFIK